ncbi:hypothetical protein EG344_13505 [Chryseobacterium sp. G0162]|uniref:hypothetical protein n=1 Tax=Chryseobacterium sp. G0162 TaxID=2487063 RepID=UPI000F5161E0|nr:hypothetical protein [Chryseobacterium sp. G0162]AZB09754.1 hypothetical protein EG344_13505 [Chryseobacterium sp. G0162]
MKPIILSFFILVSIACLGQEKQTEFIYKFHIDNINKGEVILEIENFKKAWIRVSDHIDNNALVVTAFQKSDAEDGPYKDVDFPKKHFDCFMEPCFPYMFLLKKNKTKQYKFDIFSTSPLEKNKWYRFKVSLETKICKDCSYISSEWIYFKRSLN